MYSLNSSIYLDIISTSLDQIDQMDPNRKRLFRPVVNSQPNTTEQTAFQPKLQWFMGHPSEDVTCGPLNFK